MWKNADGQFVLILMPSEQREVSLVWYVRHACCMKSFVAGRIIGVEVVPFQHRSIAELRLLQLQFYPLPFSHVFDAKRPRDY